MPSTFFGLCERANDTDTDTDTDKGTYTDTRHSTRDTRNVTFTCIARHGEDHMITVVRGTCVAVQFFFAFANAHAKSRKRDTDMDTETNTDIDLV